MEKKMKERKKNFVSPFSVASKEKLFWKTSESNKTTTFSFETEAIKKF